MRERPGVIIAGKYRLEKPLARGGVGTVWIAHHVQLGHAVAVKFLDARVATSAQVRARFEREARAAALMRSPHIVQVFDYGIQDDAPYLVMELLRGETLSARLRNEKRLSLTEAHRLLVQVGRGLKRAHEAGFVHRDLKPANLYLARSEDGEDETVKILDFGIAKETGGEVVGESTRTGELVGSPHYMSPEQIRGEREVDARSDLWAIGVILYRMLTGVLPFPGEVLTAVITKIVVDPIPSVREHVPDASEGLEAFFQKALARDRAQRFQTVRQLVDAFSAVVTESAGGVSSQVFSSGHPSLPPLSETRTPVSLSGGSIPGVISIPPGSSRPGESLSPGSYPGGSFPGGSFPASVPPGSFPGGSFPGTLPSASAPSSLLPSSIPPGSTPSSSLPGGSIPPASSPTASSFAPASASTILSAAAVPAAKPPASNARWAFVALGAVLLIAGGVAFFVTRPAAAPRPASPPPSAAPVSSSAAPAPPASAPAPSASAAPSSAQTQEVTTPAPTPTLAPSAAPVKPRPASSGTSGPANKKKPVNTID